MERVCEPELMDGVAQADAYAAADFSAGDQALLARLVELFGAALGPRLIDLGCGPGNISFLLAERYPAARVVAVDGAPAMLRIARSRQETAPSCWPQLEFVAAQLTPQGLRPPVAGRFTAVVSNSLLHHLHDPQVLWTAVGQLGAPGAAVYIKDLRRPASAEAVLTLRDRYLAGAPAVLQHDYVASLHAAFTAAEVRQQLVDAGLAAALQVAELDDRYLEVWGRLAG
jgi:SAM-dependent methyltransferase